MTCSQSLDRIISMKTTFVPLLASLKHFFRTTSKRRGFLSCQGIKVDTFGQGVKDETARKRIIEHLSSIRNW